MNGPRNRDLHSGCPDKRSRSVNGTDAIVTRCWGVGVTSVRFCTSKISVALNHSKSYGLVGLMREIPLCRDYGLLVRILPFLRGL